LFTSILQFDTLPKTLFTQTTRFPRHTELKFHTEIAKARIRLEIEIGLEFNQLEERKSISSLVNFALID